MGLDALRTLVEVKWGGGEGAQSAGQTPQLHLGMLTRACLLCLLCQLGPHGPDCNFLINALITLVDVLLNWLSWFHFLFLGSLLIILIDCMIFLSPFLDVTRMPVSTNSFLAQLDSIVGFLLTYNLNVFKSRINTPITRFFLKRFSVCFNVFMLFLYLHALQCLFSLAWSECQLKKGS